MAFPSVTILLARQEEINQTGDGLTEAAHRRAIQRGRLLRKQDLVIDEVVTGGQLAALETALAILAGQEEVNLVPRKEVRLGSDRQLRPIEGLAKKAQGMAAALEKIADHHGRSTNKRGVVLVVSQGILLAYALCHLHRLAPQIPANLNRYLVSHGEIIRMLYKPEIGVYFVEEGEEPKPDTLDGYYFSSAERLDLPLD